MVTQKSATSIKELKEVVDKLETTYNRISSTTNERELSQVNSELRTMFQAVQWNLYSLARAVNTVVNSRRAAINSNRIEIDEPVEEDTADEKPTTEKAETTEETEKESKETVTEDNKPKKKQTRKGKK